MNNNMSRIFSVTTVITFIMTHSVMAANIVDHVATTTKNIAVTNVSKATPLARVMLQSSSEPLDEINVDKNLLLEISELKDSSGLVYFGGKVSDADLSRYLEQLKDELGEEQYAIYRQYQAARDHQSFHVTLINPYEYQTIDKEKLNLSEKFRVTLHGLGKAEKAEKSSYFVVVSSADGQFIRQKLLLNNKDFHITLGFSPADVFGVSKGRDTLIKK
tara:strand:+ start:45945 stop:46595 length:651 start_codon:yes stop_codon:yes gene_type:complete